MIIKFNTYIKENNSNEVKKLLLNKLVNVNTNLEVFELEYNQFILQNVNIDEYDIHPMDGSGNYFCKITYYKTKYYFQITDEVEFYFFNDDLECDDSIIIEYNKDLKVDDIINLEEKVISFNNFEDLSKFYNEYFDFFTKDYYNIEYSFNDLKNIYVFDNKQYSDYIIHFIKMNYNELKDEITSDEFDDSDEHTSIYALTNIVYQYCNDKAKKLIDDTFTSLIRAKKFDLI